MNRQKIMEILQTIDKKIYKFRYVLEFIFALIAIVAIYKMITIHHYFGHVNVLYLIIAIIFLILMMANIVYCCFKGKNKIEKIFLTFMIPVGMLYLVFVIPSHVPDEPAHLWKSYEVSTGKFITAIEEDGQSHINIPKDLQNYKPNSVQKYNDLEHIFEKTDYRDTVQVVSSAQNYSFILYIGSALGFVISRIFQLNILVGIYLGKIFNFIIFLAAGYYSIKLIPFGKILLSTYLFIPMIIHQAISFSADSITNIVTILFIAYILKLTFTKENVTKKQNIILIILSILLGIVKIAYIPLLGLTMMLLFNHNIDKKQKWIVPVSIILGFIAAIAMYVFSLQYIGLGETSGYNEENNINTSEQIRYIIEKPRAFLGVLKTDWIKKGEVYLYTMIGSNLGWLKINVNRWIIIAFIISIMLSIIVENNKISLSKKQKIWAIVISAVTVILIETVMYISWSELRSGEIMGIQGRYFIPVAILPLIALCMKDNYLKFKNINIKILMIVSLLNVFVIKAIYGFFI